MLIREIIRKFFFLKAHKKQRYIYGILVRIAVYYDFFFNTENSRHRLTFEFYLYKPTRAFLQNNKLLFLMKERSGIINSPIIKD